MKGKQEDVKVEHTPTQVEVVGPKSRLLEYLPAIYQEPGTTRMRMPDGTLWDVPNDRVDQAKERGAGYAAALAKRPV